MPRVRPKILRYFTAFTSVSVLLAFVTLASPQAPQPARAHDETEVGKFQGVLLLKNGSVVAGEISRIGNRWFVKNSGSEVQIPEENADLAAGSLDELYLAQKQRVPRPTAEAHLALADWCIRNCLLPQAETELAQARRLDHAHPRLRLYEQRLAIASLPRPPQGAQNSISSHRHEVAPVSHTQEVKPAQAAAILAPAVSEVAIERFTRRIQPILVNNCTTSGCHRPGGAQSFQLDRALLHGLSNRRTTMSNLQAALDQVDRQEPLKSPLLAVPRLPHGSLAQPVFGPNQRTSVEQILEWVTLVSESPLVATEAGVQNATAHGAESSTTAAAARAAMDEVPVRKTPLFGAQPQPWRPKDEFDPEIFNRRYHGELTSATVR
jgi:hypothetical protein